jgi:hypothetical protein
LFLELEKKADLVWKAEILLLSNSKQNLSPFSAINLILLENEKDGVFENPLNIKSDGLQGTKPKGVFTKKKKH